jgi:hypothetical protein
MNRVIWKLLFVLILFVTLAVSFSIYIKAGFPEVTYWIGVVLGVLEGIVSVELKNAYKQ